MLTTILIGAGIGAALTLEIIFTSCEVKTKKAWAEHYLMTNDLHMRVYLLEAEKGRLRIALAAGEMTEDGKKVATMTMAALDAVIAAAKKAA